MLKWNKQFYLNRLRCKNAPYLIERFNQHIAYFVAYNLPAGQTSRYYAAYDVSMSREGITEVIGEGFTLEQIKGVCERHYSEAKQAFLDKLDTEAGKIKS